MTRRKVVTPGAHIGQPQFADSWQHKWHQRRNGFPYESMNWDRGGVQVTDHWPEGTEGMVFGCCQKAWLKTSNHLIFRILKMLQKGQPLFMAWRELVSQMAWDGMGPSWHRREKANCI